MRKIKKKCCAIVLSLVLAISMIWQSVPVLAEEGNDTDLDIAKEVVNSYRDIDEAPPVSVSEYEESHIPQYVIDGHEESFIPYGWDDSNNTSLPAVENQDNLGTCWAHSVMSMIEMNLANKGNYYYENMSEFQSVFFMNHDWIDPLGLCSGDNFRTVDENTTTLASNWYDHGGNTAYTKFMLMDWVGAVSENDYTNTAYNVLLQEIQEKGTAYLDDSYAITKDRVHVQDVNVINTKDTNVIKQMIKEYGAVGISYFHDDKYYNKDENTYYNSSDTTTNHAVALIGWDNNFDKTKFNTEPSNNGAWLVRNSWGRDWGKNGYFWISYEDTSLAKVAYSLDVEYKNDYTKDENYYDNNYQYDGGVSTATMPFSSGIDEANVFVANGKEELKAVAIYAGANYNYDIKIYTNLTNKSNPISGTLVAEKSGTQIYEGYHTIKLDNSIMLSEGEIFSVVVTLENNNNDYTHLALDTTLSGTWMYSESEAKSGQSFYRPSTGAEGYSWTDAAVEKGANVRIKAYTNNYAETPITSIYIENISGEYTMNVGETYNLAGNIVVEPENHSDKIIYSSDNEDIASVDSNGLITALMPGDVYITAKAYAGGVQARIHISVKLDCKKPITSIYMPQKTYNMHVGDIYNLTRNMIITPNGQDDLIIYSSSDKSIAAVDNKGLITALKIGDAEITATSYTNNKITANIKIHVIASNKPAESITLSTRQMTLLEGDTEKIDATLTPADSNDKITWTSDNPEAATVDANGTVTGVVKGKATITATTTSGKSASCAVKVKKKRGETIPCVYNKIPKKIYKFNTYKISLSDAMKKLSPTKIDWVLNVGNKDNIVLTPVGENGKDGCDLYVKQVTSVRNRGEKLRLDATVTYIKNTRKGEVTKTKKYRKAVTSYNLSYELVLDTEDITINKKGDTIPLNVVFNDGDADDLPTNTKIKWMLTDAAGKKDRYGSRVISVNSKGIIKSKGPGVTYVTAFATDSYIKASKSYAVSDTIKVTCVPVTSVSFSETSLSLAKLSTADLKAKLIFNNGTEEPFNKDGMKLKWTSSNKKIVSVNGKGVAKVTNKANAGETCKITVQATGGVPRGQTVPQATIDIIVQ